MAWVQRNLLRSLSAMVITFLLLSNSVEVMAMFKHKKMVVFMHDIGFGPNKTAYKVASAGLNSTGSRTLAFGDVVVFDDLITQGPKNTSRALGKAQGMYANVALSASETNLQLIFSIVFRTPELNGTTLQIQGADRLYLADRDLSVMGGTGAFSFAHGIASIHAITPELLRIRLRFRHE